MRPVMLATDGSPTAESATATAIELAQLLDAELVIVTAWDVAFTGVTFGSPVPPTGEIARLTEEEAHKVNAEASARAEEAGVETRSVVLRGFPIEEICIAAEKFEPRFLVIGSHGWGPIKRAIFGSVSSGVLHHATCPVLVVRGQEAEESVVDEREREQVPA